MLMTFEESERILYPTKSIPENLDYTKIKLKFMLNTLSENILDECDIFSIVIQDNFKNEYSEKQLCEEAFKIFDKFDVDDIDAFFIKNKFDEKLKMAFEEMHEGDCTAMASTCLRCYYREIFGFKYDGPSSKNIGWTAYHVYNNKNK